MPFTSAYAPSPAVTPVHSVMSALRSGGSQASYPPSTLSARGAPLHRTSGACDGAPPAPYIRTVFAKAELTAPLFGSDHRTRRPTVLVLVFGVLLVLVGVTATAQAAMVSAYASTTSVAATVDSDLATVRGFVHDGLDGIDPASPDAATVARINAGLQTLLAKGEIVRAEFRAPDGRVIASSDPAATGAVRSTSADFATAVAGTPGVAIVDAAAAETDAASLPATVLREYVPLRQGDRTLLVLGVWRDAVPLLTRLDDLRRDVVLVTLTAAVIAAAVLFLVFRSAQVRISRQTDALVGAARTDSLTGTLNHGALVAHLAGQVEDVHGSEEPIAVALVDIDNFRLLNDTHGHRAGDDVLLLVAETIRDRLTPSMTMGRYGPDEFLVIAAGDDVDRLEDAIEGVRASLVDVGVEFDSTDRIPVSVSAGLCRYPDDGRAVTELLATAAATLHEA